MYAREGRGVEAPAQGVGVWVLAGRYSCMRPLLLYPARGCARCSALRSSRLVRTVTSCFRRAGLVVGRQRKKFTTESFVRQALIHVCRYLGCTLYPKASKLSARQARGFVLRIVELAGHRQTSFLLVCVSIHRPCVLVSGGTREARSTGTEFMSIAMGLI